MLVKNLFNQSACKALCSRSKPSSAYYLAQWGQLRQSSHHNRDIRQWSTPLAQTLAGAIKTTGPISIAAFMRQCLTSPTDGYYTSITRSNEHIGQKGDFITSPEISQVFGELVAVWFVSQWITQGRPTSGVVLVELGPGKGTLMDDILRTIQNFHPMRSSVEAVYLLEASKRLREQQHKLLCGTQSEMKRTDSGWQCNSKYANIPVYWCEDISSLPTSTSQTPFIIAHEFFDALPIQAFQSVPPNPSETSKLQGLHGPIQPKKPLASAQVPQWRELLVNVVAKDHSQADSSATAVPRTTAQGTEFELTLAKASNPSSVLLPEASERYKALKNHVHSIIEISPESQEICAELARRIGGVMEQSTASSNQRSIPSKSRPSGAALIIDYGPSNTIPTNTLRGIRSHKQVSPFLSPGEVDLSADVDFTALAEAAIDASEGVEVHGPIEQGEWLQRMGIHERAQALSGTVKKDAMSAETVRKIETSVQRLTERGGGAMGKVYKFMAIVPESGGRRPVGFGGIVEP